MTVKYLIFGIASLTAFELFAQQAPTQTEKKDEKEDVVDPYEAAYQERIQKEYLFGVYIPRDLADCFIQLNRLIDRDSRQKFKQMSEADAAQKLHFSLGRWMTHNWGLYGGSRLSYYLSQLGLGNPDNMVRFIIITYHRNLNKEKLEVKALIEHFQAAQQKQAEDRLKQGKIIHEERRKRQN